jgi:hypothetical protein
MIEPKSYRFSALTCTACPDLFQGETELCCPSIPASPSTDRFRSHLGAQSLCEFLAARVIKYGFQEFPGGLGLGSASSELISPVTDEDAYIESFAEAAGSLSFTEAKACMAVLRGMRTAMMALHIGENFNSSV